MQIYIKSENTRKRVLQLNFSSPVAFHILLVHKEVIRMTYKNINNGGR